MATAKQKTEASEPIESVEREREEEKKAKTPVKLDDSLLVSVQSNVHGQLIYDNPRSGSRTEWHEYGEIQSVPMGDLRAMKAAQRRFFSDNWILVKGIDDPGYEGVTPQDIYQVLGVSQMYRSIIEPEHFEEFFRLSRSEMKKRIELLTDGAKLNLVVAANSAIRDGILDSVRTIRTLEELLGCELLELK